MSWCEVHVDLEVSLDHGQWVYEAGPMHEDTEVEARQRNERLLLIEKCLVRLERFRRAGGLIPTQQQAIEILDLLNIPSDRQHLEHCPAHPLNALCICDLHQ